MNGISALVRVKGACLGGSVVENLPASAVDMGSIPGLGRPPREELGDLLLYSYLENPCGQRSLAGYSPWSCKDWDMTGQLNNNKGSNSLLPLSALYHVRLQQEVSGLPPGARALPRAGTQSSDFQLGQGLSPELAPRAQTSSLQNYEK